MPTHANVLLLVAIIWTFITTLVLVGEVRDLKTQVSSLAKCPLPTKPNQIVHMGLDENKHIVCSMSETVNGVRRISRVVM